MILTTCANCKYRDMYENDKGGWLVRCPQCQVAFKVFLFPKVKPVPQPIRRKPIGVVYAFAVAMLVGLVGTREQPIRAEPIKAQVKPVRKALSFKIVRKAEPQEGIPFKGIGKLFKK